MDLERHVRTMPIRKRFQRLTPTFAAHEVPEQLGVFEVAGMDGRILFIGYGKLRQSLVTLAQHHPEAYAYRFVRARSRPDALRIHRRLKSEHEERWLRHDVVERSYEFVDSIVEPCAAGPRRKMLAWPRDLAIRWDGAWIPLEMEGEGMDEMAFRAAMPGGGEIRVHLDASRPHQ